MGNLYYTFVDGTSLTIDVSHMERDGIIEEYIKPLNKGEWVSLIREKNGTKEFHAINPANVIRVTVTNK